MHTKQNKKIKWEVFQVFSATEINIISVAEYELSKHYTALTVTSNQGNLDYKHIVEPIKPIKLLTHQLTYKTN